VNRLYEVNRAILLVAVAGLVVACAQMNPLSRAETVEQKAFAAYGTFVIVEEQAAKLVASGQLSANTVQAIAEADARAKPVADSLVDATLEFAAIKAEFEAGGTGEEQFVSAMNNLNSWIERVLPLITNLKSAVSQGEGE
jgi:hypothetical protein